jgi:hypothetical protein
MRAFFRNKPFEGEPIFRPGGSRVLDSNVYFRYGTTVPQSAGDLNSLHERRYGLPAQRAAQSAPRSLAEFAELLRQHYAQPRGR